tara:strand:+ start:539 stop:1765 length:1227 start_codon:yes stop_codon:yes gene_type:complete
MYYRKIIKRFFFVLALSLSLNISMISSSKAWLSLVSYTSIASFITAPFLATLLVEENDIDNFIDFAIKNHNKLNVDEDITESLDRSCNMEEWKILSLPQPIRTAYLNNQKKIINSPVNVSLVDELITGMFNFEDISKFISAYNIPLDRKDLEMFREGLTSGEGVLNKYIQERGFYIKNNIFYDSKTNNKLNKKIEFDTLFYSDEWERIDELYLVEGEINQDIHFYSEDDRPILTISIAKNSIHSIRSYPNEFFDTNLIIKKGKIFGSIIFHINEFYDESLNGIILKIELKDNFISGIEINSKNFDKFLDISNNFKSLNNSVKSEAFITYNENKRFKMAAYLSEKEYTYKFTLFHKNNNKFISEEFDGFDSIFCDGRSIKLYDNKGKNFTNLNILKFLSLISSYESSKS